LCRFRREVIYNYFYAHPFACLPPLYQYNKDYTQLFEARFSVYYANIAHNSIVLGVALLLVCAIPIVRGL